MERERVKKGTHTHTIGLVHEGALGRVRDALPHADGFGVAGVHGAHVFIVPPVSAGARTQPPSTQCIKNYM